MGNPPSYFTCYTFDNVAVSKKLATLTLESSGGNRNGRMKACPGVSEMALGEERINQCLENYIRGSAAPLQEMCSVIF
jgi:hypothetical protein